MEEWLAGFPVTSDSSLIYSRPAPPPSKLLAKPFKCPPTPKKQQRSGSQPEARSSTQSGSRLSHPHPPLQTQNKTHPIPPQTPPPTQSHLLSTNSPSATLHILTTPSAPPATHTAPLFAMQPSGAPCCPNKNTSLPPPSVRGRGAYSRRPLPRWMTATSPGLPRTKSNACQGLCSGWACALGFECCWWSCCWSWWCGSCGCVEEGEAAGWAAVLALQICSWKRASDVTAPLPASKWR